MSEDQLAVEGLPTTVFISGTFSGLVIISPGKVSQPRSAEGCRRPPTGLLDCVPAPPRQPTHR